MLRTQKTNSLGLLLPQQLDKVLENPYHTQFLQGIGRTCNQEGYTLLLAPPLRGSMLKSIPYAVVDGFIVSGLEYDRGEVSALRQRSIPFVLVDSEHHEGVPSVEIDDADGCASSSGTSCHSGIGGSRSSPWKPGSRRLPKLARPGAAADQRRDRGAR